MPFIVSEDGLTRTWKPNSRQEDFLQIPDSVSEAMYGGAVGGGKTEVLLFLPIVRRFYENPAFKGILFRRTFPELEKEVIPRALEIYKYGLGAEYNEQKHLFIFPSGSRIFLSYLEKDQDARKHDSAEYNLVSFDEATSFTEFMYLYMISRCRTSRPNLPAIMRLATNPGNIGHTWVRDRFVAPWKTGNRVIVDKRTGGKRIFIPAKLQDNPHMMTNDPNYINRLQELPESERKAKMEGDWYTFHGQVFSEFRMDRTGNEPENALHVIDPFPIPSWWPKLISVDWGFSAKTFVIWWAIAPDGKVFIYREYSAQKKTIKQWGADVKRLSQFDENIKAIELDPSAWQQRGDEMTIADQFCLATGWRMTHRADNDRVGGKNLIHEFLRWEPRPSKYVPREGYVKETADRIFRMYGIKALKEYEEMFTPEPIEINIPRLQIFNTCSELIETIPLCVYDEKRKEDIQDFDGDDPIDCLRYGAKGVDRYVGEANRNRDEFVQRAEHIRQLERTGNQTAFYRKMELMESKTQNSNSPVHRGRRWAN